MRLNKFAYLYSKPLGNHTLKIMKKIPGNLLKNLEKSWKYHGILSVPKSGNPEEDYFQFLHTSLVLLTFNEPAKNEVGNISILVLWRDREKL